MSFAFGFSLYRASAFSLLKLEGESDGRREKKSAVIVSWISLVVKSVDLLTATERKKERKGAGTRHFLFSKMKYYIVLGKIVILPIFFLVLFSVFVCRNVLTAGRGWRGVAGGRINRQTSIRP